MAKYCMKCGQMMADDARFCPKCGAPQNYQFASERSAAEEVHSEQPSGDGAPSFGQQPAVAQPAVNVQQPHVAQPTVAEEDIPQRPDTHLALAIISTVLCCWLFGIIGIVYAARVDSLWADKRYQEAIDASRKARKWSLAAIIGAAVFVILYVFFILLLIGVESGVWSLLWPMSMFN